MDERQKQPRGLKPLQRSFFAILGQEKPKPIPPKLVRIYGYPLAAIISQLLFWKGMGKRRDGLIYKTEREFLDELGLSSAQQKLAIKKGRDLGFLIVIRKGIPAKRHWDINYDLLLKVTFSEARRKNINLTKRFMQLGEKSWHGTGDNNPTITDNTPKTTARYHKAQSTGEILLKKYGK